MNTELAMKALEAAKASPENFNMETFFSDMPDEGIIKTAPGVPPLCGTTACYAGFASLLAAPVGSRIGQEGAYGSYVQEPGQGNGEHVETYAMEALGITIDQAAALFYLNTIDQVERAVKHLAENPDADGDALWAASWRGNA